MKYRVIEFFTNPILTKQNIFVKIYYINDLKKCFGSIQELMNNKTVTAEDLSNSRHGNDSIAFNKNHVCIAISNSEFRAVKFEFLVFSVYCKNHLV